MRRLVVILADDDGDVLRPQDALLFSRLMELKMQAERQEAPEASRRVIGRIRRLAGAAAVKGYPPGIRGH